MTMVLVAVAVALLMGVVVAAVSRGLTRRPARCVVWGCGRRPMSGLAVCGPCREERAGVCPSRAWEDAELESFRGAL
jgi:hypothetical protein